MRIAIALLCLFALACGGDSPTTPSPQPTPQPAPAPAPVALSLSGTVTSSVGGPISGATVRFLDGPNSGRSTTTSTAGAYRFDGVTAGNTNLATSANCHNESRAGVSLFGAETLNFTLPRTTWTNGGSGNTVFDIPSCVTRVRISGTWNGSGNSNFIVYITGRLTVNEILRGTPNLSFSGTYLIAGGTVQIVDSTFIRWTFSDAQ